MIKDTSVNNNDNHIYIGSTLSDREFVLYHFKLLNVRILNLSYSVKLKLFMRHYVYVKLFKIKVKISDPYTNIPNTWRKVDKLTVFINFFFNDSYSNYML